MTDKQPIISKDEANANREIVEKQTQFAIDADIHSVQDVILTALDALFVTLLSGDLTDDDIKFIRSDHMLSAILYARAAVEDYRPVDESDMTPGSAAIILSELYDRLPPNELWNEDRAALSYTIRKLSEEVLGDDIWEGTEDNHNAQ